MVGSNTIKSASRPFAIMPDGNYNLGEFPVVVAEGTARLDTGNLAGSILKLKEAIKNVVDWGIATPAQAIMMASLVPAII